MLKVSRSNDLEALVQRLAAVLARPPEPRSGRRLSPLEPEIVLIQSAGMERYLSRELALHHGVVLGTRFPYPRAFLVDVVTRALDLEPGSDPYSRERLSWTLLSILEEDWGAPQLAATRRRLGDDPSGERRFFLAERLAHLFDQYATYRPELLREFEQEQRSRRADAEILELEGHLFRRVLQRIGPLHFAARARRFLDEVTDERLADVLPLRLSIVGGVGLPPLFLRLFERIASVIDVELLSFSASAEYFAGLSSGVNPGSDLEELPEGVHPLLASLGKMGGDFQQVLEDIRHEQVDVPFRQPRGSTLLGALQADIASAERRTEPLDARLLDDGTLEIASCHGPRREVEVVTERIFAWLSEDPSLRPEDIVVLLPDVELYAPLVSSVLDARQPRLPHRVADRSERSTSPAARALLAGLSLLGGRFKVSEVLDFLQLEPVLAKFEILPADLERIGDWVESSGIRWGIDAEHKAQLGVPATDEHTWKLGLERLLLGFALEDDGETAFRGLVPVGDVRPGDAALLSSFVAFASELVSFQRRYASLESMADLGSFVGDFAVAFLGDPTATSEARWDTTTVLRGVRAVFERPEEAGFERSVPLSVVLHLLELELEQDRSSTEFLAGGVTFCALLPLRTIPFRRVCVLGLDQGSFPRMDQRDELDLIARSPRPGDRTLRDDDRYLFLELLLSAQDGLYLSYVGRSIQDDSERPPSVVLAELMRTVRQMVSPSATASGAALTVFRHPLQPFSPRYFRADSPAVLRSSDRALFRAAVALAGAKRTSATPFVPKGGALDGSEPTGLALERSVEDLVRFVRSPARAYLSRLEVRLDDEISTYEDREAVALGSLDGWGLGDALLSERLEGKRASLAIARARGALPVGAGGDLVFADREVRVEAIVSAIAELRAGEDTVLALDGRLGADELRDALVGMELSPLAELLDPREVHLHGQFVLHSGVPAALAADERANHLYVDASFSKLSARREALTYVRHLVLAALAPRGVVVRSCVVGDGGTASFDPLEPGAARKLLSRIVALSVVGTRVPIPLFLEPSSVYVAALVKNADQGPEEELRRRALVRAFRDSGGGDAPDKLGADEKLVFRGIEPPDGFDADTLHTFHAVAIGVLRPVLDVRRGA